MGNCFSVSLSCDPLLLRCWDCASGEMVVMLQMEDKMAELEREKAKLIEIQHEVNDKVTNEEDRQGRQRLPTVGGWLSRVEAKIPEIDDLLGLREQEVKKLCFGGRLSKNCKSSIEFGKSVASKVREVVNLREEGRQFNQVTTSPPAEVLQQPCGRAVGSESTLEEVCSCIREERAERIGLCGLGGVGKTTLLKQLNNKYAGACKDFDPVIWVVVSQKFEIGNVQDEIWKQIRSLDEQWKCKRTEEKAVDIHNVLLKKKFLLLLDDVWEAIDLEKVGVPSKQKGSHVVFTTRSMESCHQMQAHLIKVEPLQWPEAWALFQQMVGEETLTSDECIAPLAESVVKKCDGLPIALITVGRTMAGKKKRQVWEHAIEVLTKAASSSEHTDDEKLFQGMKKQVLGSLKFSYDSLQNDRVKSCFLYCSLFPEDYKIDKQRLIDLWICETFWDDYDDLTKARNKGYGILDDLIHSCLIEEEGDDFVKMHDVVRDMALWLTHKSEERKETFLVRAKANLVKAPAAKKWEGISRMSLMMNSIAVVEEVPMSTDILTLSLNGNPLRKLPDGFLQSMKALTVLDLSNTHLEELPRGLSALTSLQHLDLSWTRIKELPLEFQQLEKLKHLNLEDCSYLTKIPKQVIFGLASLKVLKLINCGDKVAEDGEEADENIFFGRGDVREEVLQYLQGVIGELSLSIRSQSAFKNVSSRCRLLSILSISKFGFKDPLIDISCLGNAEHLHLLEFDSLKGVEEMIVGFPMKRIEPQDPLRTHGSAIANTKICFKSLTEIFLINCGDLKHITWVALVPNLRILQMLLCKSLQEVISQNKLNDATCPFAKLETLSLNSLPELKSIFWKPLPFPTLKKIDVLGCPKLKKLPLNSDSAKGCNLVITGSDKWWQVIEWEDDAAKHVFQSTFEDNQIE